MQRTCGEVPTGFLWGEKNWRKQTTRKKCRGTWENNIKLDIKEIESKVVDWIRPARLL